LRSAVYTGIAAGMQACCVWVWGKYNALHAMVLACKTETG